MVGSRGELHSLNRGAYTSVARRSLTRLNLEVKDGYVYVKYPSRDVVKSIASESLVEGQA